MGLVDLLKRAEQFSYQADTEAGSTPDKSIEGVMGWSTKPEDLIANYESATNPEEREIALGLFAAMFTIRENHYLSASDHYKKMVSASTKFLSINPEAITDDKTRDILIHIQEKHRGNGGA